MATGVAAGLGAEIARNDTVLLGVTEMQRAMPQNLWIPLRAPSRLDMLVEDWGRCGSRYWTSVGDHMYGLIHVGREIAYRTDDCGRPGCPRCAMR